MDKIIFAAALLGVLTLTIAIGVTTTQHAQAVVTYRENCHHSIEQCFTNDLKKTLENAAKGFMADDNN
jgi:hypothetical protein